MFRQYTHTHTPTYTHATGVRRFNIPLNIRTSQQLQPYKAVQSFLRFPRKLALATFSHFILYIFSHFKYIYFPFCIYFPIWPLFPIPSIYELPFLFFLFVVLSSRTVLIFCRMSDSTQICTKQFLFMSSYWRDSFEFSACKVWRVLPVLVCWNKTVWLATMRYSATKVQAAVFYLLRNQ